MEIFLPIGYAQTDNFLTQQQWDFVSMQRGSQCEPSDIELVCTPSFITNKHYNYTIQMYSICMSLTK